MNNVNVEALKRFVDDVKRDPANARRSNQIEGNWNVKEGSQFVAEIKFEKGVLKFEVDQPSFLGGWGTQPNPFMYCFFGLSSCFATTFATLASMEGIQINAMKVIAQVQVDHSRALGLSENPPIEKFVIRLEVDSSASKEKLKEIAATAHKRCPAIYCLTHLVPVQTDVSVA